METAAKTEAAPPPSGAEQSAERIVMMTASTDPQKAMADIAQQRAEGIRRNNWRRASQAVLLLGALLAGWLTPRFREHGLAAAPASSAAPVAAPADAPVAPTPSPVPATPAEQTVEPVAAVAEDPATRCEDQFKARTWRLAIESCNAAFDATPTPPLAMRIAHAHFSHGDTAGAATWARNALELGSTDPDAYVLIGNAEQAAGKRRKAIAAYRRYLELAPRGWHAARLRSLVE